MKSQEIKPNKFKFQSRSLKKKSKQSYQNQKDIKQILKRETNESKGQLSMNNAQIQFQQIEVKIQPDIKNQDEGGEAHKDESSFQYNYLSNQQNYKKIIPLLAFTLIFGILSAIVISIILTQSQKSISHPQVVANQNILQRNYKLGEVYHNNFVVNTTYENYTIRVTYQLVIAVTNITSNVNSFMAAFPKMKQQKIQQNGNINLTTYFTQNVYLKILQNGIQNLTTPIDPSLNQTENNNNNYSVLQPYLNANQSVKNLPTILPIFRFELQTNGKIATIEFITQMPKQQLGLLRSVIKLFSPLLDTKKYKEGQTVSKKKLRNQNGQIQQFHSINGIFISNNSNETYNNNTNQIYEQENNYGFESDQQTLTLKNEGQISSSSDTHNTNETCIQTNEFANDGKLQKGSMQSNTDFQSDYIPSNENASTLNLNLNFSSYQKSQMSSVANFITEISKIQYFVSLMIYYQNQNQTMNVTVQGLIDFIIGSYDSNTIPPARLLLQSDGSLSLIKFDKEVPLLSTSFLGFKITATAYSKVNLNIYQDQKNKYKKTPKFKAEVGTILKLGAKKFVIPLQNYTKQFPPISLQFTLEQIQNVIKLIQSDFIGKVLQIYNLLTSGHFTDNLLPNIMNVVQLTQNVSNAISTTQQNIAPTQTINKIITLILDCKDIIDSQGMSLLNPQNSLTNLLSSQLLSFVGVSYNQALAIFKLAKDTFKALKQNGFNYLTNMLMDYPQNTLYNVTKLVYSLIPTNIYAQYQIQMQKAKPIFDLINLVQGNGNTYLDYILNSLSDHKYNLLETLKNVIDLYFQNQTSKTNNLLNIITHRINEIIAQNSYYQNLVRAFDIRKMDAKCNQLFRTILMQQFYQSNYYLNEWMNRIENLKLLARGVSSEKGECCQMHYKDWYDPWDDDHCVRYNDAFGQQSAEPTVMQGLSTAWKSQFQNMLSQIVSFTSSSLSTLNSDLAIPDKYSKIQQQQTTILDTQNNLTNDIMNHMADLISTKSKIGCGGTSNIQQEIIKLSQLAIYSNNVRNQYQTLLNNIESVLNTISVDTYQKLRTHFVIVDEIPLFVNSYQKLENQTKQIISNLFQKTINYQIESYMQANIVQILQQYYDNITSSLSELCYNFNDQKQTIMDIRNSYNSKLKIIQDLSKGFFTTQINQILEFLNSASTQMFDRYLNTPFCSDKQSFSLNISQLLPDLNNFTILFTLYENANEVIRQTNSQIDFIRQQVKGILGQFYILFTPQDTNLFINKVKNLGTKISQFVTNVSMIYSQMKEKSKQIRMFQMAPIQQLQSAIQIFASSKFVLSMSNVFNDLQIFVNNSLKVVSKLSYDLISVIVLSNDVVKYYQSTISTFKSGIQFINSNFTQLCESFLNLEATTGQQYLNNIHKSFQNLLQTLNSTIFPNIEQNMKIILNRFTSNKTKSILYQSPKKLGMSKQLQQLKQNCINVLKKMTNITVETRTLIFNEMKVIMNKLQQLISKLEIGSINQVYQLANYIKNQFSSFLSFYSVILQQLSGYRDKIVQDLRNIFKFGDYFINIKKLIQTKYQNTTNNILSRINNTQNFLKSNSNFYNKFINSNSYSKMSSMSTKLVLNFTKLWSSVQQNQAKIEQHLKQMAGDAVALIKQLGDAQSQLQGVQSSVKNRIKNITNLYYAAKMKLTNIKSLIFTVLSAELGHTVMNCVHSILAEVDNIVYVDLKKVQEISTTTLGNKVPLIGKAIQATLKIYTVLKTKRDTLVDKLNEGAEKIDSFLKQQVTIKMQKLKDGVLHIKSVSSQPSGLQQTFVLYEKQLYHKRAPITKFQQPIVTAIGTFLITLQIDYIFDISAHVYLRDFRSVDFNVVFQGILWVDFTFSYGIPMILQFGLFVTGNALRANVIPGIYMNNVIPLVLVEAIADIPQINQNNVATVVLAIDIALYAVQLQIGFYIKHIWLEIIWQDVELCINALFFHFCIKFKLPIGFRFTFLRHDFGFKINGIEIFKKRVLEIKLLQWKY